MRLITFRYMREKQLNVYPSKSNAIGREFFGIPEDIPLILVNIIISILSIIVLHQTVRDSSQPSPSVFGKERTLQLVNNSVHQSLTSPKFSNVPNSQMSQILTSPKFSNVPNSEMSQIRCTAFQGSPCGRFDYKPSVHISALKWFKVRSPHHNQF